MDKTDGSNPTVNTVAPATPEAPTTVEAPAPLIAPVSAEPREIPAAVREASKLPPDKRLSLSWKLVIFGLVGFFLALAAGALVAWKTTPPLEARTPDTPAVEATEAASPVASSPTVDPSSATPTPNPMDGTLLGHLPYEVAPPDTLVPIVADGSIMLRDAAAEKFNAMVADAEYDGVYLVPVSGFRSIEDQEYLFFEVTAEKGELPVKRAEVSAPPGYSEHHTGYAVDIEDGDRPDLGLVEEFDQTAAFKWLQQNAAYYSFEMSFPRNNPQGVNYEPWHWRFVGDRNSLETFYRASQLGASASQPVPQSPEPDNNNPQ